MRQVKRLLPYVRRYVQMAVYDVLDAEGAEYWTADIRKAGLTSAILIPAPAGSMRQ